MSQKNFFTPAMHFAKKQGPLIVQSLQPTQLRFSYSTFDNQLKISIREGNVRVECLVYKTDRFHILQISFCIFKTYTVPAVWEWCVHTGSIIQQQFYHIYMIFTTCLERKRENVVRLTFFFSIACIVNCLSQTSCLTWNSGVIPVFVRQSLFATFSRRSSATSL